MDRGQTHAAGYDANGNIIAWANTADGTLSGTREYGAFGENIASTGVGVVDKMFGIPFGFSTKYQDRLTSHYYYGYRFYNANTGRWLSKDPIDERGGLNLYAFVGNNGVSRWDLLGMRQCKWTFRAGHGTGGDYRDLQAESNKTSLDKIDFSRSKCGDRYGVIGCRMNSQNLSIPEKHRIPWMPKANEDKDGGIATDSLLNLIDRVYDEAKKQAERECDDEKTCCSSVKFRMECSASAILADSMSSRVHYFYNVSKTHNFHSKCGIEEIFDCETKKWSYHESCAQ